MSTGAEVQTYYALLGVSESASFAEIRDAFRTLLRRWHPDVSRDPRAHEMTVKLNEAWEVLKNPASRAEYDQFLKQSREASNSHFESTWSDSWTRSQAATAAEARAQQDLDDLLADLSRVAVAAAKVGAEAVGCIIGFYWRQILGFAGFIAVLIILGVILAAISSVTGWEPVKRNRISSSTLQSMEERLLANPAGRFPGRTGSLHLIAGQHDRALAERLIAGGADVNAIMKGGYTPLHVAAAKEDEELTDALLDSPGIQVNIVDDSGSSPLRIAAETANLHIVQALIRHGANPNAEGQDGATPLDAAAAQGSAEVVEILIEAGADVTHRAPNGMSALDVAEQRGNLDAAGVIRLALARQRP